MKYQDITIKAKSNGVEARVGCMELVYTDMKMFLKDLKNYLSNPEKTEKEIRKRWKINDGTMGNGAHNVGSHIVGGSSVTFTTEGTHE